MDDRGNVITISGVKGYTQKGDTIEIILKTRDEMYRNWLKEYGDSPRGVGWANDSDQKERVEKALLSMDDCTGFFTVLDIGCGTGYLYFKLCEKMEGRLFKYRGIDILDDYIKLAKSKKLDVQQSNLFNWNERADYVFSIGVLHMGFSEKEIVDAIKHLWELSNKKLVFTVLHEKPGPHFVSVKEEDIDKVVNDLSDMGRFVKYPTGRFRETVYLVERKL